MTIQGHLNKEKDGWYITYRSEEAGQDYAWYDRLPIQDQKDLGDEWIGVKALAETIDVPKLDNGATNQYIRYAKIIKLIL